MTGDHISFSDKRENLLREVMAFDYYPALHHELRQSEALYDRHGVIGLQMAGATMMHYSDMRNGDRGIHDLDFYIVADAKLDTQLTDIHGAGQYKEDMERLFVRAALATGCACYPTPLQQLTPNQQRSMQARAMGKRKRFFTLERSFEHGDIAGILAGEYGFSEDEKSFLSRCLQQGEKAVICLLIDFEERDRLPLLKPRTIEGIHAVSGSVKGLLLCDPRIPFCSKLLRICGPQERRKATDVPDIIQLVDSHHVDPADPVVKALFIAMMAIYKNNPESMDISYLLQPSAHDINAACRDLLARTSAGKIDAAHVERDLTRVGSLLESMGIIRDGQWSFAAHEQEFLDAWFKGQEKAGYTLYRCDVELLLGNLVFADRDYFIDAIKKHPLILSASKTPQVDINR